jgi:hypothetical protein
MADIIIDGTSVGANRFLLLDSTGKIPAVDGSQVTTIAAGNIATGTIPIARIDTGSTANKIVVLDGSGRLPAVSATLITNLSSSTKSASDPTISTNPSGGVGTEWQNTTSGEAYICTDATAGANVWTNVGAGSGNVRPYVFQGSSYGYACGGYLGKAGPTVHYGKQIQKFSLTTDGNSTDIADILSERRGQSGVSSSTHGYVTGGHEVLPTVDINRIERFPFATDSDSVDWADLTETKRQALSTMSSGTHGWTLGGEGNVSPYYSNRIDKFPYATETNATDWADCIITRRGGAGCSSATYGYSLGGTEYPGGIVNRIEKFPFATQTNSVDVADITVARESNAGVSSETDAYCIAGTSAGTNPANSAPVWDRTEIDKHSFASGGNSTDHGDLPVESGAGGHSIGGVSGTTHGYSVGGIYSYNNQNHQYPREQIEKFAYSSNVTATDVGDLVEVGTSVGAHFGMDSCSPHQF